MTCIHRRTPRLMVLIPALIAAALGCREATSPAAPEAEPAPTTATARTLSFRQVSTGGAGKVPSSARLLPLLDQRAIEGGRLLFRSPHVTDREAPLTDLRDLLDRVARRAGWEDGDVRTRMFRVTYATARLQTLDHGARIAPWTVEKELGHATREMLEEVYGRLGDVRHRSDVVEYRVEQHFDKLGDQWIPIKRRSSAAGSVPSAA